MISLAIQACMCQEGLPYLILSFLILDSRTSSFFRHIANSWFASSSYVVASRQYTFAHQTKPHPHSTLDVSVASLDSACRAINLYNLSFCSSDSLVFRSISSWLHFSFVISRSATVSSRIYSMCQSQRPPWSMASNPPFASFDIPRATCSFPLLHRPFHSLLGPATALIQQSFRGTRSATRKMIQHCLLHMWKKRGHKYPCKKKKLTCFSNCALCWFDSVTYVSCLWRSPWPISNRCPGQYTTLKCKWMEQPTTCSESGVGFELLHCSVIILEVLAVLPRTASADFKQAAGNGRRGAQRKLLAVGPVFVQDGHGSKFHVDGGRCRGCRQRCRRWFSNVWFSTAGHSDGRRRINKKEILMVEREEREMG